MATFSAVFSPKSQSGGISDNQSVTTLAAASASSTLVVGKRQKIAISVTPGTVAATTGSGAAVRFSIATSTAASTDFILPLNTVTTWETGDEFDSVSFYNINATTGTLNITVMRLGV